MLIQEHSRSLWGFDPPAAIEKLTLAKTRPAMVKNGHEVALQIIPVAEPVYPNPAAALPDRLPFEPASGSSSGPYVPRADIQCELGRTAAGSRRANSSSVGRGYHLPAGNHAG